MGDIRINKIQSIQPQKIDKKEKQEEQLQQQVSSKNEATKKDAKEVLEFMANSSALNQPHVKGKTVDVAKHVSPESQQRIEKMMQAFDQTILKSAEVAIKEFGLSENDGRDVAIMAFNQKYLV